MGEAPDDNTRTLPTLEFTDSPVPDLVAELADEDTLIVSGPHGYPLISGFGRAVQVDDNTAERVEEIREGYEYSRVLAYGGCTALDVARAVAVGKELIVIPASISTSCISVDKSIINYGGEDRAEHTVAPSRVIVSLTDMLGTDHVILDRLSCSGFGDYFANIGASIDVQYRAGDLSMDAVRHNVPENFEALEWVRDGFNGYDEECMRRLATYAHNSSVGVIERGDGTLSAGGEHKLYYQMMAQHDRYRDAALKPTHGELVAVGTLVAGKLLGEETGDISLYEGLREAYGQLGLPTDYAGLSAIGIGRGDLVQGLEAITDTDTYLGAHFAQGDYAVLDRVFGG